MDGEPTYHKRVNKMSISSLGRTLASPSLREPVSSNQAAEAKNSAAGKVTDLAPTQVTQSVERPTTQPYERSSEPKPQALVERSLVDEIQQFQDLMQRNSVEFAASGPLSSPELKIVDHVNNIDFEREIPPQAFKERIFELREDFVETLSSDNISFDTSAPLSRMVLVIKENINETEFVRQLPRSINDERVRNLIAFASEQGFNFNAVA
jgi:hypothetical protein